jgi:hypothetical protein
MSQDMKDLVSKNVQWYISFVFECICMYNLKLVVGICT